MSAQPCRPDTHTSLVETADELAQRPEQLEYPRRVWLAWCWCTAANIEEVCSGMTQAIRAPAGLAKWQITRALNYIEQHLPDKITIADLARLAGVSCHWFQRAFKLSVGTPPYRFIAGRRLALACMLLETTREPLSQVALSCGLYDHAHFCRVFRRCTGMNPAAWRRANAGVGSRNRQPRSLEGSVTLATTSVAPSAREASAIGCAPD
jgi:AraC-like DNA-binding protein